MLRFTLRLDFIFSFPFVKEKKVARDGIRTREAITHRVLSPTPLTARELVLNEGMKVLTHHNIIGEKKEEQYVQNP